MRITKRALKQIIKEEIKEVNLSLSPRSLNEEKAKLQLMIHEELVAMSLTPQQIDEVLPKVLKKWGSRAAMAGALAGAVAPGAAHAGDSVEDYRTPAASQQAAETGEIKVTDANGDTWKIDKESGFGTLCSETECRAKQFSPQEIAQLTGSQTNEAHQMPMAGQYRGMGAAYNRDYGAGNLTLDDVKSLLPHLSSGEQIDVWEKYQHLNNQDDLRIALGLEEVSSEKQRRWACAQKDKPASKRAKSLSAAEADEMCRSKVEEA